MTDPLAMKEEINTCENCREQTIEFVRFYHHEKYCIWCLPCYTEDLKREIIRQIRTLKFRLGGD